MLKIIVSLISTKLEIQRQVPYGSTIQEELPSHIMRVIITFIVIIKIKQIQHEYLRSKQTQHKKHNN